MQKQTDCIYLSIPSDRYTLFLWLEKSGPGQFWKVPMPDLIKELETEEKARELSHI